MDMFTFSVSIATIHIDLQISITTIIGIQESNLEENKNSREKD